VLHWDGSKWTRVPSPTPPGQIVALFSVSAVSATDVWAVGRDLTAKLGKTLVLHWDGKAWTQVPSPTPGLRNGGGLLTGVSALTGSDAWASGLYNTNSGGEGTLLLHWDGSKWTRVPSPTPRPGGSTGGSFLNGVDMVATGDVWSAGGTLFDSTGRERTLLLHWNGMTWTRF
jgi:hypothetical protein